MRIVSFLPSATEILFALGAAQDVVGVTFECDFPPEAWKKPHVVHSHLPPGLEPSEIDAVVRSEGAAGRNLYFADIDLLEALAPDLIILQDLCRVCAIDSPTLARDMSRIGSRPRTLSLSAHTLGGIFTEIELVGETIGRVPAARALTQSLRARVERVRACAALDRRPRVLCLEWLDPFFQGGHWVPEMVELAGGNCVLATPGEKSVRLTWDQVRAADPEIIIVMPCGYDLAGTIAQYRQVAFPVGWPELHAVRHGCVYAVNGSAYFSRPGPRVVDGLEIVERIVRGESLDALPAGAVQRLA